MTFCASGSAQAYELPQNLLDHPCLADTVSAQAVNLGLPTERGLFPGPDGALYIPVDIEISNLALTSLQQITSKHTLTALPVGDPNRWGYTLAWIVTSSAIDAAGTKGALLQDELIAEGHAISAPREGSPACATHLLKVEQPIRSKRAGLWAEREIYATKSPGRITEAVGTYVITEGHIVSLGKTASTRYLNFGRHWKTDFTATFSVSSENIFQEMLEDKGLSLDDLEGRAVQLRGVIEMKDGPLMRLMHPGQLAVIGREKDEN